LARVSQSPLHKMPRPGWPRLLIAVVAIGLEVPKLSDVDFTPLGRLALQSQVSAASQRPLIALVPGRAPSVRSGTGVARGAAPAAPLVDCAAAALGFFNNLRLTSALLTGAALGGLFNPPSADGRWERSKRISRYIYLIGMALTVTQCLMVVFICTIASTTILLGGLDTKALDAKHLLEGPLALEYASCRAFFMTSLTWFLAAIASKVFIVTVASEDAKKGETYLGCGIVALFVHIMCAQHALINKSISASFGNLGVLYVRVVGMWLSEFHPLVGVSSCMQCFAYIAFVCFSLVGLKLCWQGK